MLIFTIRLYLAVALRTVDRWLGFRLPRKVPSPVKVIEVSDPLPGGYVVRKWAQDHTTPMA